MFFFTGTATTEIYTDSHTLSLHDALPHTRAHRVLDVALPIAFTARPQLQGQGATPNLAGLLGTATCLLGVADRDEGLLDPVDAGDGFARRLADAERALQRTAGRQLEGDRCIADVRGGNEPRGNERYERARYDEEGGGHCDRRTAIDRKSTRLNSSH